MIDTLYPNFREKWSNGRGVFITSDTHFDDEDRNFMGYDITEKEQIAKLKKYVNRQCLIHLGDVGNPEYLKELNCYKVLIMGNHDERVSKFKDYFDEIYTGPLFIAEKLVLSHEPICVEAGITRNPIAFNIHGHDHSGEFYNDDYHLNVCQNVFGYEPLNLKDFIKDGLLASIKSIHREIIDNAINRKNSDSIYDNRTRPCKKACRMFVFAPDECNKCEFNENTNPFAKQTREKEEAERLAWQNQQGQL